jgi:hypothetical protein
LSRLQSQNLLPDIDRSSRANARRLVIRVDVRSPSARRSFIAAQGLLPAIIRVGLPAGDRPARARVFTRALSPI